MESVNLFLETIIAISIIGISFGLYLARYVLSQKLPKGEGEEVSKAIQSGANAYLKRQFKTIAPLVIIITILLYISAPVKELALPRSLAFVMGALFSSIIGTFGMNIATKANARVTQAANKGFKEAMILAFRAGATTGMLTIGLGLLGATIIYSIFREKATEVLVGFGFGGSLLALFMKVGGGIYTKAADIGADLVGKVEKNIPEDDPRNAAVIADQVGDNVGDCAGMAADIFGSYEVTLVAAIILGELTFGLPGVLFPLAVRALGIITSIIGILSVNPKGNTVTDGSKAVIKSFLISSIFSIAGFLYFSNSIIHSSNPAIAATLGIILALVIFLLTDYATGDHAPVKNIAKQAQSGAATTILSGLVEGFSSTVWAIVVIGLTIIASFLIFNDPLEAAYGVALAGMGMLTTTGLIVSMDSFGPIADNAQGIAELAKMKGKILNILPKLDSIGNTTKATTKGFAIGSAVIAAVSLFESYMTDAGLLKIDIATPYVFVGLLIGGAVPFLFSALSIKAVSESAHTIINEVRRQFKEIPGIMEGTTKPDYEKVVDLTTKAALSALATPAIIAITTPILIGLLLKTEGLGAFLAGSILSGQLLAVFMANAGGAWDNAKKMIEDGLYGGKGSDAHKAAVISDTVGDPLKDTAGPSMNPLIKVINLVALLIAPIIAKGSLSTPATSFLILALSITLLLFLMKSYKESV